MSKDRSESRRKFLKSGAMAVGSATLAAATSCTGPSRDETTDSGKPVYRTLGRTGLRLPVVSMGSAYAINLFRAALDAGIVYVHTSSSYSERNHERMLGETLRGVPRNSFVIATTPDLPYRLDGKSDRSLDVGTDQNPALIAESLEGSLQRLGLDYVDIYYLPSIGRMSLTTSFRVCPVSKMSSISSTCRSRISGISSALIDNGPRSVPR